MLRTHDLGSLRSEHIGQTVTLAGWVGQRRDHGGVAFVDLRDARRRPRWSSVTRLEVFHGLRNEYVLQVIGIVVPAPRGQREPRAGHRRDRGAMPRRSTVLNTSEPLPFQIDEHVEVGEEARLKHRYLDLRRPRRTGPHMRLRSEANRVARELLHQDGFVEIETPTLTRSTPEGARDFLVPARLAPGFLVRAAAVARSCSSSSCRWAASRSTTRSPAATATRTSARTASRSSPSSTSRASFVEQDDIIAPRREHREGSCGS